MVAHLARDWLSSFAVLEIGLDGEYPVSPVGLGLREQGRVVEAMISRAATLFVREASDFDPQWWRGSLDAQIGRATEDFCRRHGFEFNPMWHVDDGYDRILRQMHAMG